MKNRRKMRNLRGVDDKSCYIRKGRQRHFRHSVYLVGWIDLLGYGSMLRKCDFDPSSEMASQAVRRLELFHKILREESDSKFPIMQINDGAVVWRELSFRTNSVTFDFLKRAIKMFQKINLADIDAGFCGARMVLATGFHVRLEDKCSKTNESKIIDYLYKQIMNSEKDLKTALYEAYHLRPYFNSVSSLQANFAFTKAYVAEGEGKKSGFEGNNLFIDTTIFEKDIPSWLKYSKMIYWNHPGLSTTFLQYSDIDIDDANERKGLGILDTDAIARRITNSTLNKNALLYRLE